MFEACKRATVEYARRRPNTLVLDFMIPSELTRNDYANWWDAVHISGPTAKRVADAIGAAMRGEPTEPGLMHILYDGSKQSPRRRSSAREHAPGTRLDATRTNALVPQPETGKINCVHRPHYGRLSPSALE